MRSILHLSRRAMLWAADFLHILTVAQDSSSQRKHVAEERIQGLLLTSYGDNFPKACAQELYATDLYKQGQ